MFKFKYLIVPISYCFIVKGLNKYYLNNDLRFLYKHDILVPWMKRIDDNQCSDRRKMADLLYNEEDISKSMIH